MVAFSDCAYGRMVTRVTSNDEILGSIPSGRIFCILDPIATDLDNVMSWEKLLEQTAEMDEL